MLAFFGVIYTLLVLKLFYVWASIKNGINVSKIFLEDASLSRLLLVVFGQNVVSGSFASVPTLAFKIFKIENSKYK